MFTNLQAAGWDKVGEAKEKGVCVEAKVTMQQTIDSSAVVGPFLGKDGDYTGRGWLQPTGQGSHS